MTDPRTAALDSAHAKILDLEARRRALEAQTASWQGAVQRANEDALASQSSAVAYAKDAERSKHDMALAQLSAKTVGAAVPEIRRVLEMGMTDNAMIGSYIIAAIRRAIRSDPAL